MHFQKKKSLKYISFALVMSACLTISTSCSMFGSDKKDSSKEESETTETAVESLSADEIAEIEKNVVKEGEDVITEFVLTETKELVVICQNTGEDYLVVRTGEANSIHMDYPEDTADSWKQFKLYSYFKGGGAENQGQEYYELNFELDGCDYMIYQYYMASGGRNYLGLKKTSQETGVELDFEGDTSTQEGTLATLLDCDKMILTDEHSIEVTESEETESTADAITSSAE